MENKNRKLPENLDDLRFCTMYSIIVERKLAELLGLKLAAQHSLRYQDLYSKIQGKATISFEDGLAEFSRLQENDTPDSLNINDPKIKVLTDAAYDETCETLGLRNPRLRIAYFLELLQKYSYSVDDGRIVEATARMHGDIRDLSLGSEIAVTVDYLDNEGSEFSESFTYTAIDEAFATDDRIILDNTDGERAVFRFYEVKRIPVKEDLFASAKKPKP